MEARKDCAGVYYSPAQTYLLDLIEGWKEEYELAGETNESAFVHIVDEYRFSNGRYDKRFRTVRGVIEQFVKDGLVFVYNDEAKQLLKSFGWDVPRDGYEAFNRFAEVLGMEGEWMYNLIAKSSI